MSSSVTQAQTYWCHECDMSVTLFSSSSSSATCPDCHGNFLEHMDSPLDNPDHSHFLFPQHRHDDTFLLDSPAFRRLILSHLSPCDPDSGKPSINSIPTIKISSSFLEPDPVLICAVCKDQFVIDSEAKQLPCNHLYHPDCILPWLSNHNSCPLCRSRLPTENRDEFDATKVEDFVIDDGDWQRFGSTLTHIARRHRMLFPTTPADALAGEDGVGDSYSC